MSYDTDLARHVTTLPGWSWYRIVGQWDSPGGFTCTTSSPGPLLKNPTARPDLADARNAGQFMELLASKGVDVEVFRVHDIWAATVGGLECVAHSPAEAIAKAVKMRGSWS